MALTHGKTKMIKIVEALSGGVKHHSKGDFASALAVYATIEKVEPNNQDLLNNMGLLNLQLEKFEQAYKYFNRLLGQKRAKQAHVQNIIMLLSEPKNFENQKTQLTELSQLGKLEALNNVREWTAKEREVFQHKKIVLDNLKQGKFFQVLSLLGQQDLDEELRCARAYAHIRTGKLKLVTEHNLIDGLTQHQLSWIQMVIAIYQREFYTALEHSKELTCFNLASWQWYELGNLERNTNNSRSSDKHFNNSILADVNKAESLKCKADNALMLKNFSSAKNALERYLSLEPLDYKSAIELCKIYSNDNNPVGIIKVLRPFTKTNSLDDTGYELIGTSFLKINELDAALSALESIKNKNSNFSVNSNLAAIFTKKSKVKRAFKHLKIAEKLNNKSWQVKINMSSLFLSMGNQREAASAARAAVTLERNYLTLYGAALATYDLTDWQVSLTYLLDAINKAPSDTIDAYRMTLVILLRNVVAHEHLDYEKVQTLLKPLNDEIIKTTTAYEAGLFFANQALLTDTFETRVRAFQGISNTTNKGHINDLFHETEFSHMLHIGRSGTGLMHNLIDNHPEVITLPSVYFSELFNPKVWGRIFDKSIDNLLLNFQNEYAVFFDSRSKIGAPTASGRTIDIGMKEGLTTLGLEMNEFAHVEVKAFNSYMKELLGDQSNVDPRSFFVALNFAYERCINGYNEKRRIFYHIHNPLLDTLFTYNSYFPDAKLLLMVRDPIQSAESWIKSVVKEKNRQQVAVRLARVLYDYDRGYYKPHSTLGLRLEDLKSNPRDSLEAVCTYLNINFSESLLETTVQGKTWWGDPTSPHFKDQGKINPFDDVMIRQKVGSLFTENDLSVLRTLLYPVLKKFNYDRLTESEFDANIQFLEKNINNPLDFELKFYEENQFPKSDLTSSLLYSVPRAAFKKRFNDLKLRRSYENIFEIAQI